MWRENNYENKMAWVFIVLVILVIALTALWLYQSNIVTFGLKHLKSNDCPGDGTAVIASDHNTFDRKCVDSGAENPDN
ncbi:MAG TPA: hypothetical protein VHA05_01565 [Candidatus Saccharimonadales bacterium]|nr:hypothetical protein [Candidatus Saccharimonadales bacterium]